MNYTLELKPLNIDQSKPLFTLINRNKEYLLNVYSWVNNTIQEIDVFLFISAKNKSINDTFGVYCNNDLLGIMECSNINQNNRTCEIFCWFDRDLLNEEIKQKAYEKFIQYIFEQLHFICIYAFINNGNVEFERMLKKNNFTLFEIKDGKKCYKLEFELWQQDKKNAYSYSVDENILKKLKDDKQKQELNNRDRQTKIEKMEVKQEDFDKFKESKLFKKDNNLQKLANQLEENLNRSQNEETCILLEGGVEMGERAISFKISKLEGKVLIDASVVKGSKTLANKVDEYLPTKDEEQFQLNREKTVSNLDLIFKNNEEEITLKTSNNKLALSFDKINNQLSCHTAIGPKINLTNYSNIQHNGNNYDISLNCDDIINKNLINRLIINPIVKNMFNSFEKKIYEANHKANSSTIHHEHTNTMER